MTIVILKYSDNFEMYTFSDKILTKINIGKFLNKINTNRLVWFWVFKKPISIEEFVEPTQMYHCVKCLNY